MRKLISDKTVRIGDFVEGLGRASHVYGALEFDMPFLATLYSFASHYSMSSVRTLPLYVMVTLKHLADSLEIRRLTRRRSGKQRRIWARRMVALH